MSEQSDDPDPSFASPKRPTSKTDAEKLLAGIATETGGELYVEGRGRTVAPMPAHDQIVGL